MQFNHLVITFSTLRLVSHRAIERHKMTPQFQDVQFSYLKVEFLHIYPLQRGLSSTMAQVFGAQCFFFCTDDQIV